MMWFNRDDERAIFMDIRDETYETSKGPVVVNPDVVADFTKIPFPNSTFALVVFDPPHHTAHRLGSTDKGDLARKYGRLIAGWEEMLQEGFKECFRVLKQNGILVFKWCSAEIPLSRVLELTDQTPLFGHRTGKQMGTHWVTFIKPNAPDHRPRGPKDHENQ